MDNKELLIHVLTKELGIGVGAATDLATECTPEQLEAVREYLQGVSYADKKYRIDNWDKYTLMMMTAFKSASRPKKPVKAPVEATTLSSPVYYRQNPPAVVKASREVKEASMAKIKEFLHG